MSKMNVIPDDRTTWRLTEADAPVLQSQHSNTTAAERDARAPADARGAERVAVHHRDHRTPDAVPSLAGLRARPVGNNGTRSAGKRWPLSMLPAASSSAERQLRASISLCWRVGALGLQALS